MTQTGSIAMDHALAEVRRAQEEDGDVEAALATADLVLETANIVKDPNVERMEAALREVVR